MDILWSRTPRENPIMPLITQDATLLSPPFCRPTGRLFHALGRTGSAGAEVCLLLTLPFQSVHRLFTSVFFNSISVFCIIVMNRATCTCSNTYRNGVCLMMDYYAHVCKNGHALVSGDRIAGQEYCEVCGAEMLDKCPSCQSVIKEWHFPPGVLAPPPKYKRAAYCKKCGKPYPWTLSAIEAAAMLIEEDGELDAELQGRVVDTLPDIITETPKTQVAVARFKKALAAAGKFTAEGLRQFAIDFGCELAKKQLGL